MKMWKRKLNSSEKEVHHQTDRGRYMLFLFSALIYAYFFGGFFPYMLLYLAIALPVMSAIHLVVIYALFKFSENLNARVFVKGEKAAYHLILQNRSCFYMPYVTINMSIEGQIICKNMKNMRVSIPPFSAREFKYDLPLYYRGRYDIGIKSMIFTDILGLFSVTFRPYEKKSVLVKPRVRKLSYDDCFSSIYTQSKQSLEFKEIGNNELINIKEYSYGDSIRKIHWKLSSKLNKTMIKETANETNNEAIFILNLQKQDVFNEEALQKEDCLIEQLVSLIYHCLDENTPVRLYLQNDGDLCIKASGHNDFNSIYEVLTFVKFNQSDSFIQILDAFIAKEYSNTLLYIFTVNMNAEIADKIMRIKSLGFDIVLYYIDFEELAQICDNTDTIFDTFMANNIRANLLFPSVPAAGVNDRTGHEEVSKSEIKAYGT